MNATNPIRHRPWRSAGPVLAATLVSLLVVQTSWADPGAEDAGLEATDRDPDRAKADDAGLDTFTFELTDRAPAGPPIGEPRASLAVVTKQRREPRFLLPPMRAAMRGVFRTDMNPSMITEYGLQLLRRPSVEVEVSTGFTVERAIDAPGPWRTISQLDSTTDLFWVVGSRLRIGPSVGASYRLYRQQGWTLSTGWVPIVGGRMSTPILMARRWGLSIDLKGTVDVARTQLVLADQQVVLTDPFELQTGLRFQFGHGRLESGERGPFP